MIVKDINIKNLAYYFFNDIINKIDFDLIQIILEQMKSLTKTILIYYIGYVTIKKDPQIYSVNPLYIIFDKVNGYIFNTSSYQ